jgi:hypothetical protein
MSRSRFAWALALLVATPGAAQQAELVARSILPAATFRAGSPPCGTFFSDEDRALAVANGVRELHAQPVQGVSSMVPAGGGDWWALADNGFAWRTNSADFQLVIYRIDPRFGDPGGAEVEESVQIRDPDRHVPWTILCDPAHGHPLPERPFNALPPRPEACGDVPEARILTGFDFDPESFVRTADGTFWISEEFGPFLLHVSEDGRLIEPPVPLPGVRSPQNPLLAPDEQPNLAGSRGPEGLAVTPDGSRLYALLEGAVAEDDARDLRIYVYDLRERAFAAGYLLVRLEMPSLKVGAEPASGPVSIGELKAVNDHEFLVIERDNLGDGVQAPRFKNVFLLDTAGVRPGERVRKSLILDLLAIPDPARVGGDGDFFRLPFYTIESVHLVDARTLLVASDNNFPFSTGRACSLSATRQGPLAPDATEIVLVRLGIPLAADPRVFDPGQGRARLSAWRR